VESSFNNTDFVTLNSIAWCSSRAVPGAVIALAFYRCRTVLVFSESIKSVSLPSTVEMRPTGGSHAFRSMYRRKRFIHNHHFYNKSPRTL
jgi:hypothetical protein